MTILRYHFFVVILLMAFVSGCSDEAPKNKLNDIDKLAATYSNLYSVIVQKDDVIIFEKFYNGRTSDDLNDVKSVHKGILSLVTGKAIDLGYLTLETTLEESLPQKYLQGLDDAKKKITVKQLLTMSSGLGGLESEYGAWLQIEDEIAAVLDRNLLSVPGATFAYSTPNLHILSVVVQETTGKTMNDFAKEHIFTPLAITNYDWPTFTTGYTGPILLLNTHDMLKLGQMTLHRGVYDGTRIISETYFNDMTTFYFTVPTNNANSPKINSNGFGLLWWELKVGNISGYMTAGYGGQFIAVLPTLNLVIAINSKANVNLATAVTQNINATSLIADIVNAVQ